MVISQTFGTAVFATTAYLSPTPPPQKPPLFPPLMIMFREEPYDLGAETRDANPPEPDLPFLGLQRR